MGTQASRDLEQILQQLHQYGAVLVRNVPEPNDLFRDAVLSRLTDGVLLADLSDVDSVYCQLAARLDCQPSADAILAALKRSTTIMPLLIHSHSLSFSALEYLFSLNAVTDEHGIRLPLLLLETPELSALLRSGEGKRLVQRIPLSFSISGPTEHGRKLVAFAASVALVLGVYSGLKWWPQLSASYAAEPVAEPAAPLPAAEPAPASLTRTSLVEAQDTSLPLLSLSEQDQTDILATVEQWRSAWAGQDWSAYLASYVDQYLPAGDQLSHDSWASLRRGRLERPAWIKVAITELKLESIDPYQVRVTFWQAYQSPGYADRSFKELRLVRTAQSWRINGERSIK